MIPKIIHQMWLDKKDPDQSAGAQKYIEKGYPETFKQHNPNWIYHLWTWNHVRALKNHASPEIVPFWDLVETIEPFICKCDVARCLVLYVLGGVYVDLDFFCVKDLNDLIANREMVIAREHFPSSATANGFIAIKAKHPILIDILTAMSSYQPRPWLAKWAPDYELVMNRTGPLAMTRFLQAGQKKYHLQEKDIYVPSQYIFSASHLCFQVAALFGLDLKKLETYPWLKVDKSQCYVDNYWIEGTGWTWFPFLFGKEKSIG